MVALIGSAAALMSALMPFIIVAVLACLAVRHWRRHCVRARDAGRVLVVVYCLLLAASAAQAAGRAENRFASVYVDGKKTGQIHYTIQYDDNGNVETLHTRVSRSILGVRIFNFDQTAREEWRSGGLQSMRSRTDDDGTPHEASVDRDAGAFKGVLDGKPIELPGRAFPASVWHYAIVRQSLLFDLMALKLMQVQVARSLETLSLGPKKVDAERFDFSGDWAATVWFDQRQQLLQFRYRIDSHEVVVRLDE